MMSYINGHKTQITGAIGILTTFALANGYIDDNMAVMIGGLTALLFTGSVVHHELKKK